MRNRTSQPDSLPLGRARKGKNALRQPRRTKSVTAPETNGQVLNGAATPNQELKQATAHRLFRSFFAAGFECSTHVRPSGWRLDLIKATAHDQYARQDYQRLRQQGIQVAREGVRWHLVEQTPGRYDFSSVQPIAEAARATNVQVIWDLCHFGWPDHIDLFSKDFITRLAGYGAAFVRWLEHQAEGPRLIVPVNEISFFSWASGDEGSMFPFATGRGFELKSHLVRATIETIKAIRAVNAKVRFVQVEPIIHVVVSSRHPEEAADAEAYRLSQYQAWDMLCGRLCPELGGEDRFLDMIGVNFYPHNQWIYNLKDFRRVRRFTVLSRSHPRYRPFREMLGEVYERYRRPFFIAETGAEDKRRRGWFRYVCEEAKATRDSGVPLEGMCLYPILNHPGWVDDRHCHNGLWDYHDERGNRKIYQPLSGELQRWRPVFEPDKTRKEPITEVQALTGK
jgi:hypothetical protein